MLNVKMTVDSYFSLYLSTSDSELGDLVLTGDNYKKLYECNVELHEGTKYYLHIAAGDKGGYAAFAGLFTLEGTGFTFANGTQELLTNTDTFKVSSTGFGVNYETPSVSVRNYKKDSIAARTLTSSKWIWTNKGRDIKCKRYFSAEIFPVNNTLTLNGITNNVENDLSWNEIPGAKYYELKRSTISGGPYTTIATGSSITYTDSHVENNITYYYIVTSALSDTYNIISNEVSITPRIPLTNILKVVLEVNEQLQLSVSEDLEYNSEMIWNTSADNIASISGTGKVTALAPGNALISVTSEDGSYTDFINILVVENADDYRLAVDLVEGSFCRLTVDDLQNTTAVTWSSMDSSIAKTLSNGKVRAISEGLTLVTATNETGGEIGQIYIRVRK